MMIQKWRLLSGSWLKVLAMVAMTVDHCAVGILRYERSFTEPLLTICGHDISWVLLLHGIGRLAFPLFAFLLVEGFLHTHSLRRYGRNIFLFALLSEMPYDLIRWGHFPALGMNVFVTLLLGFLALLAISRWEQERLDSIKLTVCLFTLLAVAALLRCDYGAVGVSFIILLYVLRKRCVLLAAIGCTMLPMAPIAALSFIPIVLYNGRRGFIRGTVGKYLFYAFYPLHLLALYLIRLTLMV